MVKMNQNPQRKFENMKQTEIKHKKKKGKVLIVLLICAIVIISIFFIAYYLGYIPIFLSAKEPIGNYETVDIENLIDEIQDIGDIPNLDKLEYKAYNTDASTNDVIDDYHRKLINEGYHLEYNDTIELNSLTLQVRGYLKGLTAVAILATDEPIGSSGFDSVVLYVTGNALDFREIIDWYQSK